MHRVLFDREYPGPSGSGSRAQHRELMRPVATMPCRVKALSCRTREDVDWIDIVHSAQKLNPWKQATLVVTGVDICVYAGAPSADRAPFWLRQSVDVEPEAETIAFTTLALVVAVTHDSTVPMEVGIKFCGEEIYRHLGPSDEVRQLLGGSGAGAGSGAGVGSAPSRSFRQAFDHALSRMAITELRLRFGSAEEAEAACSCVCNAVDTFTSAGPWLSAGLPLHFAPQVALAAATDTRGPGAAAAPDVVLAVCPEWDAPLQLPDGWAAAAEAAELPGHLLLLLHTPTGPHLCSLPRSDAAQLLTGEAGSSEDWGGLSDECGSSAPTPRTPQLRLPSASGRDDSRPATSSSSAGRPRVWQRRVPPLPVYYVVQCSLAAAACSHEGGSECSSSGSAGGHEAEAAAAGQAPGLVEGCCLGVLLFWALQCLVQLIQHCQLSWAAISTALATLAAAHLLLHRAAPPPLLQRRLAAWRRRLSHRRAAAPAAPAPEAAPASCQLTLHGCEACREPPPSRVMLASEWRLGGSSWHGSSLEEEVGGELYAHARPATATTTAAALTAGRHLPGSCAPSVSAPLPSSPASSHDAAADGRGRDAAPPLPQGSPDGERADAGEEPAWMTADVKQRFVNGCRGNLKLARRRLQCTADWRAANAIDSILQRPQPCFGLLKRHFPHGVHCMTADGNTPVLIMKFGEMKNAYDQMVADGITAEKGMLHMAFVYEWVFNVLSPGHLPLGNLVNVFDLAGMGFGDLRSDAMKFAFSCADVAGTHYPERLLKAFIVNVPFWFSVLWGMTSPLLEERTRKRTLVLWKKEAVREEMLKLVAEEELPVEYGGLCTRPLADSPRERELYAMVQQLNSTEAS